VSLIAGVLVQRTPEQKVSLCRREIGEMAPEVGFEPTTNRLTADRSTTELLRSVVGQDTNRDLGRFKRKLRPVTVIRFAAGALLGPLKKQSGDACRC
jgi:hypothetical protein